MTPTRLRIRELREARGWSQLELAERADMRQATISDMETGKVRRIDVDAIARLCSALGVQPGDLIELVSRGKGRTR